jgi:hypothetical protein
MKITKLPNKIFEYQKALGGELDVVYMKLS